MITVDRRRTMGKPYDSEVEYIEGTGTQYIDTGLKGNSSYKYVIDYQATSTPNKVIFGMRNQSTYSAGPIFCYTYKIGAMIFYAKNGKANSTDNSLPEKRDTNRHTLIVDFKNEILTLDGNSASSIVSPGNFITDYDVFLMSNNVAGTTSEPALVKIFAYQVFDENNKLIQNFKPVRIGNIGYAYDTVNDKVYRSNGEDDFIVGNDITI